MSISLVDNLNIRMQKQNVERDAFKTIADMKAFPETSLPPIFHSMCEEDGNIYVFNKTNADDATTGKWRLLGGSSSSSGIAEWKTNSSYDVGILVLYDSKIYQCITGHTSTTFSADIANWQIIGSSGINLWATDKDYFIGNLAINDNRIYRCIADHTSTTFSADATNWVNLSDDNISATSGNVITRASDGLFVGKATNTSLGAVKVDGKTISAAADGEVSVKYSADANNNLAKGSDGGLYLGYGTDTVAGAVKVDNSTIGATNGVIASRISSSVTVPSEAKTVESSINGGVYTYTNNNSKPVTYRVTYIDQSTTIVSNGSTTTLTSGSKDGTLQQGQSVTITAAGSALFQVLTRGVENIITVDSEGLMIDRYANRGTSTDIGFMKPDNDTTTVDDNGVISSTIGINSVSGRQHNLIKLIKTYTDISAFPEQGAENVIYRIEDTTTEGNYVEYSWDDDNKTYVLSQSIAGSLSEDGIYIDEDETVPIATYDEEGKVRPDNDTILLVDDTDAHNGQIKVNTDVIATQTDVNMLNKSIDTVDVTTPKFIEYTEDELYDIVWGDVKYDAKPEYTESDLDSILDEVFATINPGGSSGLSIGEITTDKLNSIWDEVMN